MTQQIDQSDLVNWLEHPITILLRQRLIDVDEDLKEMLMNPSIVLGENGLVRYAGIAAKRELIDEVLNLQINHLIDIEDTDNYGS